LIGLFKKTVLADNMVGYATPVFGAADNAGMIHLVDAWTGALAIRFNYTLISPAIRIWPSG